MENFGREPEYVTTMADGTVKQLNPFTGTEVWTVAGRGNRPLGIQVTDPVALDPADAGAHPVGSARSATRRRRRRSPG